MAYPVSSSALPPFEAPVSAKKSTMLALTWQGKNSVVMKSMPVPHLVDPTDAQPKKRRAVEDDDNDDEEELDPDEVARGRRFRRGANESWDRFLPKFKKRNVKSKKPAASDGPASGSNSAPVGSGSGSGGGGYGDVANGNDASAEDGGQLKKKKKVYTPFPPAQMPRKIDLQMESGEYFLKPRERQQAEDDRKRKSQEANAVRREEERAKAYIPPEEPTRTARTDDADNGEEKKKKKKRKREEGEEVGDTSGVEVEKKEKKKKHKEKDGEETKKKKKKKRRESSD
ncbi:unnamed protein product [Tilletia laevis]|uniref:Uncharacterized protein n=2 Tax=Tilletia TaxID=13289 RepID=A0A9N8QLG2_9BASI|nr:unnamed protein product [Tilletia laevis]CAD7060410.1 unnamed protein product [Tilletia caries]